MKINFEYVTNLQYEVKALRAKVEAYETGKAYLRQQEEYEKKLREKDRTIASLKKALAESHMETATVRRNWMEVIDDVEKELKKLLKQEQKKTSDMQKRALAAEEENRKWHEKWKQQQAALYAALAELEEEKGKNCKLTAQVNRDFENSSIPSSLQKARRKKIPNSRVKTGKRPGAQPGHKGHRRRQHVPTESHEIPAPEEYSGSCNYYETGKIVRKQKIAIQLNVKVIEYWTKEYRNRTTGARVHAPFPDGYVNEMNCNSSARAHSQNASSMLSEPRPHPFELQSYQSEERYPS